MLTSKKILALTVAVTATGIAADTFAGFDGTTAAAGARAFGVVNDQYAAGEYAPVVVQGTAVVIAAEAIAVGQDVQVGADGQAAVATTGVVVGVALTAAAAAGDRIEVLLK